MTKKSELPEIEVLNVMRSGAKIKASIYVKEGSVDGRKMLAEEIKKMLKNGHYVFLLKDNEKKKGGAELETSHRILGYDPETNEWIVRLSESESKKDNQRISAKGTKAASLAPAKGG